VKHIRSIGRYPYTPSTSWMGRYTVHKSFYDVLERQGILPLPHLREYCCTSWVDYSIVPPRILGGSSEIVTLGFILRHPFSTTSGWVKPDLKAFRDLAGPLPASLRVLKVAGYFHLEYADFFFLPFALCAGLRFFIWV